MDLLYAHQRTCVWRMTRRLEGHSSSLEYSVRGWPFFETTVSQLVTLATNILDLGTAKAAEALKRFEGRAQSMSSLAMQASYVAPVVAGVHGLLLDARRPPPLLPVDFEVQMGDKTLAKWKDAEVVIKLQRKVVTAVLGSAKSLNFSDLRWGVADARLLVKALPWCHQLHTLTLKGNMIFAEGAAALAAVLRENATSCTSLE